MVRLSVFSRSRAWLVLCGALCLGVTPSATLPPQVSADIGQSYELLTTTYYQQVDPHVLLAAASDALSELAHKNGVSVPPPSLRVESTPDATMAELDDAIVSVAQTAHGSPVAYAYAAIDAMTKSVGDRYTQFLTPDEFKAFNDALDPERISGIGVIIEPDPASGSVRIAYVVPGTPADRAGLKAADVFTAIGGTPAKGLTVDAASRLLRGAAGSIVTVTVDRAGQSAALAFSMAREEVQPPTVVSWMLPGSIGYVYVMAFGRATPSEFNTALSRLKEQGAKALVLDLRNDGGGYVNSALKISSRFIANKALVVVEERGQDPQTIDAENDASVKLPVTVLVNQYTASASEITAGALQDDGVAMLIGTKTFGKGVMQTLTPLPDGAAIKITTAHYLTPSQRDINLRGIDPDLRVDENRNAQFGQLDKDAQLRAAVDLLAQKIAKP
jgi:carboxyl-terminal processing protease